MALFTVRATLRKQKRNKKGEHPVAICITMKGDRIYRATGIVTLPENWDLEKSRVKADVPNADIFNERIDKMLIVYQRELLLAAECGELSSVAVKEIFVPMPIELLDGTGKDVKESTLSVFGSKEQYVLFLERQNAELNARVAELTGALLRLAEKH